MWVQRKISIKNLIKNISKLTNLKLSVIIDKNRIRPAMSEVTRLKCDNSKIKKIVIGK